MPTLLVVEDDRLIAEPMSQALSSFGYTMLLAYDGRTGLEMALVHQPDMVILDILLPELDGWEVCKALRQTSTVPILMLSSLNDEVDRILGLELGADDYLTKPFSLRELLAHIKALLRRVEFESRQATPHKNILMIGALTIDLDKRTAFKGDRLLSLRYKAFELLSLLVSHAGEVMSRAEIFDKVWGTDWIGDTRTLEVHIRWLREQIEDDPAHPQYIQTVRSVGYRFIGGAG
jgi:DNA-binding response OmpR family regulator